MPCLAVRRNDSIPFERALGPASVPPPSRYPLFAVAFAVMLSSRPRLYKLVACMLLRGQPRGAPAYR